MTWRDFIEILLESPLYFTMTVRARYIFLVWMAENYTRRLS